MAERQIIPNENHAARHCTPGKRSDTPDGWLKEYAFAPREGDPEVSVNWIEYYGKDRAAALKKVWTDVRNQLTVRPSHFLAILHVGHMRRIGSSRGRDLRAVHDPIIPKSPSHSKIVGIPLEDRILHQYLADSAMPENAFMGGGPPAGEHPTSWPSLFERVTDGRRPAG